MKMLCALSTGICVLLLPLFYSGCDEDAQEDKLPPVSMDGKHTFGCLVEGQVFIPKAPQGQSGLYAELTNHQDTMEVAIYVSNYASRQALTIHFYISPILEENKIYDLKINSDFLIQYTDFSGATACTFDIVNAASLSFIRIDSLERILAGTFELELYCDECDRSVKITEGRFDIGQIDP